VVTNSPRRSSRNTMRSAHQEYRRVTERAIIVPHHHPTHMPCCKIYDYPARRERRARTTTAGRKGRMDRVRESEHGQKVEKGNPEVHERQVKQERTADPARQLEVTETTVLGQNHRANHKRIEHLDCLESQHRTYSVRPHANRNLRLSCGPHLPSKSCLAIHQC
jgi:hypothetical protein